MSVATGGLVGTEEGQEHRSAVLCLSRAPDTKTLARSGRVSWYQHSAAPCRAPACQVFSRALITHGHWSFIGTSFLVLSRAQNQVVCTELIAQSGACCGQRWEQKEIFSSDSMLATLIYWWSIHTVLIWSTLFYNSTIPRRKELFHKMISFKPCLLCLVCDCVDVTVHVFPEIMSGEWQAVSSSHGPAVATTLGQEWTRVSGVRVRTLWQQAASNDNLSELNISQHF